MCIWDTLAITMLEHLGMIVCGANSFVAPILQASEGCQVTLLALPRPDAAVCCALCCAALCQTNVTVCCALCRAVLRCAPSPSRVRLSTTSQCCCTRRTVSVPCVPCTPASTCLMYPLVWVSWALDSSVQPSWISSRSRWVWKMKCTP
jgi:hypothetical protein